MKIDLSNVTFNIPVKIDTIERQENLAITIEYLYHHFNTNIIVYEVANEKSAIVNLDPRVRHIIEIVGSGPFHRTKYLNEMALISRTPIIVNYDCDVLFQPNNYIQAVHEIIQNKSTAAFPYDGLFLNIKRNNIPYIREHHDLTFIDPNKTENYGKNSMGGAIFWNKQLFIKGGMENENFISWGYEDWERIHRFKMLGGSICRVRGPLYHLDHPRGKDSCDGNPYYAHNGKIYEDVTKHNASNIHEYIAKQPWMQIFN